MDGLYKASIDPLCEVKGGVSFWFARLTQDQIKALEARHHSPKSGFRQPSLCTTLGKSTWSLVQLGLLQVRREALRRSVSHREWSNIASRTRFWDFFRRLRSNSISTRYSNLSEAGAGVYVYNGWRRFESLIWVHWVFNQMALCSQLNTEPPGEETPSTPSPYHLLSSTLIQQRLFNYPHLCYKLRMDLLAWDLEPASLDLMSVLKR